MTYDNTNRGVLFTNNKKTKENSPDRTGTINIEGKEYKLAGWLKTSSKGAAFLSLSVSPADKKDEKTTAEQPSDGLDDMEPIPF
jgi:hypothetical protein